VRITSDFLTKPGPGLYIKNIYTKIELNKIPQSFTMSNTYTQIT